MQELQATLRSSAQVDARGESWLVVEAEQYEHVTLVTLRGVGPDNLGETQRLLAPFDLVRAVTPRSGLARRARRRVLETVAAAIADSPEWGDCWTAGSAHIDLRSWQLEPALAAIGGAARILLADEVGLGKTIQALLIVSELCARGLARRTLVLTPASLREQWSAEMADRFGLRATVFDHGSLAAMTAELPVGVNPWNTATHIVASIDLVKRPEVRTALDAVPLDILVVDEAHHLTPGSDRGAVVADLAQRTPWLILITATPHSGDEAAYRFIRGLGDVNGHDDLMTYRRTAAQVRAFGSRHERLVAVEPTDAEHALLDRTLEYTKALWRGPGAQSGARLVASVIARRAASSAEAARQTLERRLSLFTGDVECEQNALPWDEDDAGDRSTPDALLAVHGLSNRTNELAWLQQLIQLAATAAEHSSKINLIRRLLRRTTERMIVFSEYRDVVQHVGSLISDLTTVAVLHGGLSAAARLDTIRSFTDGHVRTLVTTDAAGEGLNLQATCRLVVNLELPWNPRRIEQRIGRVDRLGQTRRVHALHLYHRGSIEDLVISRLERRRLRAALDLRDTIGAPTEHAIAAAVFEECAIESVRAPILFSIGPSQSERMGSSMTERRLRSLVDRDRRPARPQQPVFASVTRRHKPSRFITLIFATDLVDATGRLVQRELTPLQIEARTPVALCRRISKRLVKHFIDHPSVRVVLDDEIAKRLAIAEESMALSASAYEQRAVSLVAALGRRERTRLYQGSLFDRRAEQKAQARETTIARWRDHLERRIDTARALRSVRSAGSRLVAAWLED